MNHDVKRAHYILQVVAKFIKENPVSEYKVFYDDAICDGSCLRDDCLSAARMLEGYLL